MPSFQPPFSKIAEKVLLHLLLQHFTLPGTIPVGFLSTPLDGAAVVRAPNDLLSACDHGHISVLWLIYRLLLTLWTITFSSRRFIPSLASHHSPCLVPLLSVHTRSVSVHCSYQTCCCAVWSASGFSPWACPVYCLYPATRSCGSPFGMAVPHACRRYSTSMDQLASLHRLFASTWNLILSNIQCWQSTAQQRKKNKLEPSR